MTDETENAQENQESVPALESDMPGAASPLTVSKIRKSARDLVKNGQPGQAAALLQRAVDNDHPNDAGLRIDLVTSLLADGRVEEAEIVLVPSGVA